MIIQRNSLLIFIVSYLIPVVVLFDWLFNLGKIGVQLGLYLKGFSIVLFLYVFLSNRFKGFYFRNILLYYLTLYLVYSVFSDAITANLYVTLRIAYWILGTFTFYYFFLHNLINDRSVMIMVFFTTIIASSFTLFLLSQTAGYQNASAYLLLWCLPLLLYYKKSKLIQLAIILSIIAIVITIKRGALIALTVSMVAYVLGMLIVSDKVLGKLKVILLGIGLLGITSLIIYYNFDKISERFKDTGGSGRDVLYTGIIKHYLEGDFLEIVFGQGIRSVEKFAPEILSRNIPGLRVAAHSDWLQNMHDFGVLGILFMVLMHIHLIKLILIHLRFRTSLFPLVIMTYTIFSLTTVYSFILTSPSAIFLGVLIAFMSVETSRLK